MKIMGTTDRLSISTAHRATRAETVKQKKQNIDFRATRSKGAQI